MQAFFAIHLTCSSATHTTHPHAVRPLKMTSERVGNLNTQPSAHTRDLHPQVLLLRGSLETGTYGVRLTTMLTRPPPGWVHGGDKRQGPAFRVSSLALRLDRLPPGCVQLGLGGGADSGDYTDHTMDTGNPKTAGAAAAATAAPPPSPSPTPSATHRSERPSPHLHSLLLRRSRRFHRVRSRSGG